MTTPVVKEEIIVESYVCQRCAKHFTGEHARYDAMEHVALTEHFVTGRYQSFVEIRLKV